MAEGIEDRLREFASYVKDNMRGYEKGEAQLFLDHLFKSFGHPGLLEAGASLEAQITIDMTTRFCDLLWPKKVLIEMKSSSEKSLAVHFSQAKDYWNNLFSDQPEFVVLCNFNEFWVYNWRYQRDPVSKFKLKDLPEKWRSLAFLLPEDRKVRVQYSNDTVTITIEAADKIAALFNSIVKRGICREKAQYFTLQCLVALFADDTQLFPIRGFFKDIIQDCVEGKASSYDLFYLLFSQMNSKIPAIGGRFKDLKFFNGGIFKHVEHIELTPRELKFLLEASQANWSKVSPSIFGNIFEHSLSEEEQHKTGAHYTPETDILRIVEPTIITHFKARITSANKLKDLENIKEELAKIRILDPACGSGNFLFVAYRELKQLELELFNKMFKDFKSVDISKLVSKIKGSQFYGIDTNGFAIELAKITLSFAKILTSREKHDFNKQLKMDDFMELESKENPLPFENLDDNFIVGDALKHDWIEADYIIGNPPFQSKNKIIQELGVDYVVEIKSIFPDVSGLADYCVYWFRKAHDRLKMGGRAGLVGTNTICQTNSREGGLDYITSNNGIITDAITSMPWQGKAVVYVSIVNWIKTDKDVKQKKILRFLSEKSDAEWEIDELDYIPASLTKKFDVSKAKTLNANKKSNTCLQGQTHGHTGFLLKREEANKMIKASKSNEDVIFPYLGANVWIAKYDSKYDRYVIDFDSLEIYQAQKYKELFERVKKFVYPFREAKYKKEMEDNKKLLARNPNAKLKNDWKPKFEKWWQLHRTRKLLIDKINTMDRYIVISQVTHRPIFDFISSKIHPNASLVVFTFNDDYSFGILQSSLHWDWIKARCSTLKEDIRYTTTTISDTFPFPQWGVLSGKELDEDSKIKIALNVAIEARKFIELRNKIRLENKWSLRDVYRSMELPGKHPLKTLKENLDNAVRTAYNYGLPKKMETLGNLQLLFELNQLCFEYEEKGGSIISPGIPNFCKDNKEFYSDYMIGLDGFKGD